MQQALIVDWTRGVLLPRPHNPTRRETFYPVMCHSCHTARYLRSADARKAEAGTRPCKICAARAAGKLGYKATLEKYGAEFFLEVTARRQREKPSSAEQKLAELLDELGTTYERQQKFRGSARSFVLDFVLPNGVLIEVNGYWHRRVGLERDSQLARDWERRVVFIDAEDVTDKPDLVKDLLSQALRS
jgi:hypothetical protein